jgi:hypothetical protein
MVTLFTLCNICFQDEAERNASRTMVHGTANFFCREVSFLTTLTFKILHFSNGNTSRLHLTLPFQEPVMHLFIKVMGVFRLHNFNIVDFYYLFYCYMFRSYDHLQVDTLSRFYSTDNGSLVFFRILDIIVNDYGDRFNVGRLLIDKIAIL